MSAPLISPEQARKLLDEVVYARVLDTIDLDELYRFEQELWFALHECGLADEAVTEKADSMIMNALLRLATERRSETVRTGDEVDCDLCAQEAQMHKRRAATSRDRS